MSFPFLPIVYDFLRLDSLEVNWLGGLSPNLNPKNLEKGRVYISDNVILTN